MTKSVLVSLALAGALALMAVPGGTASCESFRPGLCPGPASCMCTGGDTCPAGNSTADNLPSWGPDGAGLGGCPGACRSIEQGECGHASGSCLKNTGKCGGVNGGCLGPAGSPCACTGKPSSGNYYLTDFDGTSCSCGPCHKYGDYFSADRQRFGCGSHLVVCRGSKCVKLRVTDYGPSCFVENDAGGPVLDASPATCHNLTGGSSCGWSDHFSVHVSQTLSPEEDGRPLGYFEVTPKEYADIVWEGKRIEKERGMAMTEGW